MISAERCPPNPPSPPVRQIVVSTANFRYELHSLDPSCLNKQLILLLYIVVIYENRISIFCDSAVNDFMQTKSQFNVQCRSAMSDSRTKDIKNIKTKKLNVKYLFYSLLHYFVLSIYLTINPQTFAVHCWS